MAIEFISNGHFLQTSTLKPIKYGMTVQKQLPQQLNSAGKHIYKVIIIFLEPWSQIGDATQATVQTIVIGSFAVNLLM